MKRNTIMRSSFNYKSTIGKTKAFNITPGISIESNKTNVVTVKVSPVYNFYEYCKLAGIDVETKTFKGVAKCNENDTYNPIIGHDIAEHRAMAKAYFYIQKCFEEISLYLYSCSKDLDEFAKWAKEKGIVQNKLASWNSSGRL